MTHPKEIVMNQIAHFIDEHGLEGLPDMVSLLLNETMKMERSGYLGAAPYERTPERQDYANGFKPKHLQTRIGTLDLKIPQVRSGDFYPSALEKGIRTERALALTVAEMYINGVSTRKVKEITRQLCGENISSSQVSRLTALLDEELEKWRNRPLDDIPFLYLDAHYEKVRHGGSVIDQAVLKAIGVRPDGRKSILGVSVALSEAEVHWRDFLDSLIARGMKNTRLIISDDHAGLKAARKASLPAIKWQRCIFHLMQNAQSHCPKKSMVPKLMEELKKVYLADDKGLALQKLQQLVKKYEKTAPDLAEWLESNFEEGLTFFDYPETLWKKIRTSNIVENLNKQIRKRTKVCGLFPNPNSALRLISATCMDISEEWETGNRYFTMNNN